MTTDIGSLIRQAVRHCRLPATWLECPVREYNHKGRSKRGYLDLYRTATHTVIFQYNVPEGRAPIEQWIEVRVHTPEQVSLIQQGLL